MMDPRYGGASRPGLRLALGAIALSLIVAGCDDEGNRRGSSKHYVPLSPEITTLMKQKAMHRHDPILIRSYKKESELEIWKRGRDGRYALLKTYPMCRWSGQLGPKIREGDRMAPEGFYAISAAQMNPNSSFHLSFDIGFPNAYDRAHGRNGSFLMVHGACTSRGCYSMTDAQIEEIYALVREAHTGGQKSVQMQALPFRMTPQNLATHRYDRHMPFWRDLKEGSDHFEVTGEEPKVAVCGKRYVFNATEGDAGGCGQTPASLKSAVAAKQREDAAKVAELVRKGMPAIRIVYDDGGQHPTFRTTTYAYAGADGESARLTPPPRQRSAVTEMSRPEALERGPTVHVVDATGRTRATTRAASTDAAAIIAAAEQAASPKAAPKPATSPPASAATTTNGATLAVASQPAPAQATSPPGSGVTEATRTEPAPATTAGALYQRLVSFSPFGGAATSPAPAPVEAVPSDAPTPPARPANLSRPAPTASGPQPSAAVVAEARRAR